MDLDDFSDIDDAGGAPGGDDNVLNQAVPDDAPPMTIRGAGQT